VRVCMKSEGDKRRREGERDVPVRREKPGEHARVYERGKAVRASGEERERRAGQGDRDPEGEVLPLSTNRSGGVCMGYTLRGSVNYLL
jgi:hypothetical protein